MAIPDGHSERGSNRYAIKSKITENKNNNKCNFSQSGGYCTLNKELLDKQMDHMSPLQSWAPELRNFVEFNDRPIETKKCDLIYEKPVYIMKIDASKWALGIHLELCA